MAEAPMNASRIAALVALVALAACNQQPVKKQQNTANPSATTTATTQPAAGGERHRGLRKACATELAQYCPGDQRGRARKECLQSHADQLSADCKAALDARGGGRAGRMGIRRRGI
jgi:hypothetical protein